MKRYLYYNSYFLYRYSPIFVWEVSLPPESVKLDWETQHLTSVSDEINEIAVVGQQVFSQVLERIFEINFEELGKAFSLLFVVAFILCVHHGTNEIFQD